LWVQGGPGTVLGASRVTAAASTQVPRLGDYRAAVDLLVGVVAAVGRGGDALGGLVHRLRIDLPDRLLGVPPRLLAEAGA